MRAMILAAGRGERLRPLTDAIPKPLIEVRGKALIEYHIEALCAAGFREIIINQGHLGEQLPAAIGDGLPLLGSSPFLVVNGDIWTDYPFARLRAVKCDWAHLVMIPNPPQHPKGDFALLNARIRSEGEDKLTFSGIGVYHNRLFDGCKAGKFSVVPLLRSAMENHLVTGERYEGRWEDIGTLERLSSIET